MRGNFIRASAMVSVALGALALPLAAHAQADAQAPQDSASAQRNESSGTGIADIVVTAQFRAQNVQDTPLAISAVSGELAAARSQYSINDIAKAAPSVNIEAGASTGGSFPSIFIRGVGQSDAFPPLDPGVGVYIDDVYYGSMTGASFDLQDTDRVEVLRGPQGTLSGKNTEGGAIKVFTNQPTNERSGYAEITYGSYNRTQFRGAVNLPIVDDKILLRVSGVYRHLDGFFKRLDYGCVNPGTIPVSSGVSLTKGCVLGRQGGGDLASVKGTLLIRPAEGIQNTVSVTRLSDHQQTLPAKLIYQDPSLSPFNFMTGARDKTSYATFEGNTQNSSSQVVSRFQAFNHNNVDQTILSNTLDIDLSDSLKFKSITAYIKTDSEGAFDNDVSPINVSLQEIIYKSKQFTQELRLSGNVGKLIDWTVGGYYYNNDIKFPGRLDLARGFGAVNPYEPAIIIDFLTDDDINSRSKSGFAHGVLHVSDKFNVTGGIRYTDDSKSYKFVRLGPDGGPVTPLLASLNGKPPFKFKGTRWDYRVAADYRFSSEFLAYAQFATGYKGGGVNPRAIFDTQALPYEPETVTSYEGGFKSDLLDRHLRLNVSGFYQKFKDIQLPFTSCDDVSPPAFRPNAPCSLTANAGKARIWGAEMEVDIRPFEGFSINASGSLVDFKFTEVNTLQSGISLTDKAPFVSKYKLAIGAQYEIPAFAGMIVPRLDLDYRSSFAAGAPPFSDVANRVGGRTLVNARLSYRTDDRDWEISLAATNLFDKFYYATKFDQADPSQGGTAAGIVGRPREVFVSVKRSF